MNIKCPYCENVSPVNKWKIFVDEACYFFESRTISKKFCNSTVCPICNKDISLVVDREIELKFDERDILKNFDDIKNAIENTEVLIDDKVAYCPYCKEWKRFYEFTFIGNFIDNSEVLVYDKNIDISNSSKLMIIHSVKCESCEHRFPFKYTEAVYPFSEETKLQLYKILKEYSLKHFKIEK